jgi:hypothetical protein
MDLRSGSQAPKTGPDRMALARHAAPTDFKNFIARPPDTSMNAKTLDGPAGVSTGLKRKINLRLVVVKTGAPAPFNTVIVLNS